jgi:hypothetical protein
MWQRFDAKSPAESRDGQGKRPDGQGFEANAHHINRSLIFRYLL